jgi:hypothetical protein
LNQISDYNPIEDGVYLCEFLLQQFIEPATIVQKTIGAGTAGQTDAESDIYPGGNIPIKPGIKGVTVGVSQGGGGIIQGDGIVQNNNLTDTFAVVSKNTTFQDGTDGSAAILCDDFAVTKADTLYLGNYEMYPSFLSGGAVRTETTNYNVTKDDWLILAVTTAGNITITLPDPSGLSGKTWVIKKPLSGHQVTINTATAAQIDGSDSHTQTSHHSYDVITTDGSQFYIIGEGH